MDKDKKQLTLREAYKAALAGEEYTQELEAAEKRYRRAWWMAHMLPILVAVALMALVGVSAALDLLDTAAVRGAPYVLVALCVVTPFVILLKRSTYRVKALDEEYTALDKKGVDDDCVKRTDKERALLESAFGKARALVDDTTTAIVRSQHVLSPYGDRAHDVVRFKPVMLRLSGLLYEVTEVQEQLERLWRDGNSSELAVMDLGNRCAAIAKGTADCYDDVYSLVLEA